MTHIQGGVTDVIHARIYWSFYIYHKCLIRIKKAIFLLFSSDIKQSWKKTMSKN